MNQQQHQKNQPSQLLEKTTKWLQSFKETIEKYDFSWISPHISDCKEEIMLEWWVDKRKVSVYFSEDAIEYLKIWGPNIFTEMEEGILHNEETIIKLWSWLNENGT